MSAGLTTKELSCYFFVCGVKPKVTVASQLYLAPAALQEKKMALTQVKVET